MNQQFSYSNTKLNQTMTNEQFDQVVSAILDGKYSWACLLILRFTGYNPLHYIPYRTYNRLMKGNCQYGKSSREQKHHSDRDKKPSAVKSDSTFSKKRSGKINELSYLEKVEQKRAKVGGGTNFSGVYNAL